MRRLGAGLVIASALLLLGVAAASAQQGEALWLGHATFRITSPGGKVIVIDPFLKKNPRTPAKYKDLEALGKVDLILVTHGHRITSRDLLELAKLTGATVVANHELANNLVALGIARRARDHPHEQGGHRFAAGTRDQGAHGARRAQLVGGHGGAQARRHGRDPRRRRRRRSDT